MHKSAFKVLTGKLTGNIPLGRPRIRWKDNVRIDQNIRWVLEELDFFGSG